MKKAFRFGVVTGGHPSGSAWMTLARRVEELNYSSLLLPDVLGTPLATLPVHEAEFSIYYKNFKTENLGSSNS